MLNINKKNILFVSSDTVYSFRYEDLLALKTYVESQGVFGIYLYFNSDKNNEIYRVGIVSTNPVEFYKDFYNQVNFSKQESVTVIDAPQEYSFSKHVTLAGFTHVVIASPTILNGNLNLSVDEDGTPLQTPYSVTAGDITAVQDLIVGGDAQIDGSLTVDGSLNITQQVVDSSTPAPTVSVTGTGSATISGKDSVGSVTCSVALAAGDVITVTYGSASTNTRVPVVTMLSKLDIYLSSFTNNSFTVTVGSSSIGTVTLFTYVTRDFA